jgi:tripartite-type tricarboxylate transporter receptor subunit TctC
VRAGVEVPEVAVAFLRVITACLFATCVLVARAEADYPIRPIRFIVPVVPGGAADTLARTLGQKLGERLGQPCVIDNRPGAGQTVGTEITARAAPDGYTIQIAASAHTINPSLWKLRYDSVRDFSAIGMVAMVPNVLVIHPSVPGRTLKEFIANARAKGSDLTFGSSGIGSASHLSAELFRLSTGVQFVHVPYKGQGQVMTDMLGGHIKIAFPSIPASIQHIKSGKLIALGVTTRQRSSALPDLPTIEEGGVPGYEVSGWYGMLAPAGMPKAIVTRLNAELTHVLEEALVRDTLGKEGAEPKTSTPEEFAKVIASDIIKWAKVVKAVGIKLE